MEFGFTSEQRQLADQVRRFLDAECPLERVRTMNSRSRDAGALDRELWGTIAKLGWPALVVPEAYGGLGLAWEDLAVLAEETGRSLFPSPLLATAVASRAIDKLGDERQKAELLSAIASGASVATLAVLESDDDPGESGIASTATVDGAHATVTISGTKMFVPWAQAADLLLVAVREGGGTSLFAVPADTPGITVTPLDVIDETQRSAIVRLEGVLVPVAARLGPPGNAWSTLSEVIDAGAAAAAAEMVGAADAAVTMAVEYAKVREQFGSPIGRFQGVKHTLAELHVGVESSRSLAYYASWAVDHLEDARREVSMAQAFATRTLDRAGEECVQIHGAIGFTWECDAQLYYKRGRYCRSWMGSAERHYERVLTSQGL